MTKKNIAMTEKNLAMKNRRFIRGVFAYLNKFKS
jgi:hypothetical protein